MFHHLLMKLDTGNIHLQYQRKKTLCHHKHISFFGYAHSEDFFVPRFNSNQYPNILWTDFDNCCLVYNILGNLLFL
jgi:hypothetical protein